MAASALPRQLELRTRVGYTGGIPEYRRRDEEIAASGYTGFGLS